MSAERTWPTSVGRLVAVPAIVGLVGPLLLLTAAQATDVIIWDREYWAGNDSWWQAHITMLAFCCGLPVAVAALLPKVERHARRLVPVLAACATAAPAAWWLADQAVRSERVLIQVGAGAPADARRAALGAVFLAVALVAPLLASRAEQAVRRGALLSLGTTALLVLMLVVLPRIGAWSVPYGSRLAWFEAPIGLRTSLDLTGPARTAVVDPRWAPLVVMVVPAVLGAALLARSAPRSAAVLSALAGPALVLGAYLLAGVGSRDHLTQLEPFTWTVLGAGLAVPLAAAAHGVARRAVAARERDGGHVVDRDRAGAAG